jgi:hypothetical protein
MFFPPSFAFAAAVAAAHQRERMQSIEPSWAELSTFIYLFGLKMSMKKDPKISAYWNLYKSPQQFD